MDPFNAKFILKEKRWLWIDYDKGISIILVGYGHCIGSLKDFSISLDNYPVFNYMNAFLYGFRMPLFFIVSGLLVARSLNKKGLGAYILDRTNNILYPLLIWGSLQITMLILFYKFTNYTHHQYIDAKSYIYLILNPRRMGHFWYLNALFCIGVFYSILKVKFKLTTRAQVILGLILYAASGYIQIHNINVGFMVHVFEYYFFFALGDLISKIMLDEKNIQRLTSWKIFVPLLMIFVVVQYYFTQFNNGTAPEGIFFIERKMPLYYLIGALIGCSLSFSFSFLLQKYKVLTFLRIVGYHSLFVYCMQIIAILIARTICVVYLKITFVPALVAIMWTSGIVLPIFFYNFCLRHNLWWLYTFRKPERHVEYLRKNNIFGFNRSKVEEGQTSPNIV